MSYGLENLEIIKYIQTNNYDRETNDYTGVNEECEYEISIIERELKALEIIKKYSFVFVENGQLKSGKYADIEILLDENDFETKEEYELLKEVLENETSI